MSMQNIILFIAYCAEKEFSPKTVMTYMHGLNFFQKLYGLPSLFDSFLIKNMLEGYKRLRSKTDARAPITKEILEKICKVLPHICKSVYECKLFTAAYSLAYFGLFRVSELVFTSEVQSDCPLQLEDIDCRVQSTAITVRLRKSKTSKTPVMLRIPSDSRVEICCVKAIQRYLKVRPNFVGFLFIHENLSPLTRSQFAAILAKSVRTLQLPESKFKTHSFRIGRATDLSVMGVSDHDIQQMGRWQSAAFNSYIRK